MEALTEDDLRACCAAPAWAAAVLAERPWPDRAALRAVADAAARALSWDDVLIALAAHPRIGERAAGDSREAAWSRQEQSAVRADGVLEGGAREDEAIEQANRAYEQKFGHVFLIFASGRGKVEILAEARRRLGNDEQTEHEVVRDELRKIALLRLERVLDARG